MKSNLLVINSGKDALHQNWIQDHTEYGFDLCLIIYDDAEYTDLNSSKAKYIFKNNDYKYKNIKKYITKEIYSKYEYIGIIDDDMETTPEKVSEVFTMAKKHNFDLCQPTLTHDSYSSHRQTLTHSGSDFRISNAVEIMCPFFSSRALDAVIDDFDTSPFGQGYGLEYSFQHHLESKTGKTKFGGWVAFIDKITMRHTKPVVSRMEVSEPDTWHYRKKYGIEHLWVFDDSIIKGYKSND